MAKAWPVGYLVVVAVASLLPVGCDVPIDSFEANRLFIKRLELNEQVDLEPVRGDLGVLLVELFGTPDAPRWPAVIADAPATTGLVSLERLQRAAGAVRSDERDVHYGLYREHCILCHGISGNGLGATSRLLNPYPRDFRLGKYKFKSTPIGSRPTRDDLERTLRMGIAGTSMPSFRLLSDEDLQALVDYVIYLSIRGEVERGLLMQATYDLDLEGHERLIDLAQQATPSEEFSRRWEEIESMIVKVAENWAAADSKQLADVQAPPEFPLVGDEPQSDQQRSRLEASIAHGRELFQGKIANCASCHGASGRGDGLLSDYDDWTKDWTSQAGLDPRDKQQLRPMLALGALKPRPSLPRNLQSGVYRGGSRPQDLYTRIVLGIEGTPMPAAAMQPENPLGLSENDVWDLVNFLLSLPDQSAGGPLQ